MRYRASPLTREVCHENDRHEAEPTYIDSDVGRQLRVEAPWFECENGARPETKAETIFGTLPPGVRVQANRGFEIAGVPQQRGKCSAGSWRAKDSLVSGSLPPGFELDIPGNNLSGISTESGHWVVVLEEDDVYCGGMRFPGFRQTLIFDISKKKNSDPAGKQ